MGPPPVIAPARPHELEAAFRLIFRQVPDAEREDRVANALRLVRQGELDAAGILVAVAGDLIGAIACLPVPGASALVWPPQAVEGPGRAGVEDALVRHAAAWLRQRGAKLGQCLLGEDGTHLAEPLLRNGFAHVTTLWYMQHDLSPAAGPRPGGPRLRHVPYSRLPSPAEFYQTLLRTYQGTEDCPEITGVRSVEEIIEGHRAQGKHDPGRWWLALADGLPVGVLLLCEMPEGAAWDVAYVGVVPEARGRGHGRELMHKALAEARADGVARLTLSVDGRNRRAWRLYRALGFEAHDRREVFLAIWR
jgi:ribosomal protein S18 acetylase RimI-like enzyme